VSYEALGALAILLGFVVAVAFIGLWVWSIVDAARRPEAEWRAAGQSKPLWLGIIIGVGVLGCGSFGWVGSLLYLLVAVPPLRRARAAQPPAVGYYG
jgi:hypothetical protein